MFKDAPLISIVETTLIPNGIGGFKETEIVVDTFNGWVDLMTGVGQGESLKYNADLQESTHICITDYTTKLKKGMKIKDINNKYLITLADDPVNMKHHLEVYLKYEGAANV